MNINIKALAAVFVSLILVGSAFVILTSNNFEDIEDETKESDNETQTGLGNETSFNEAVNDFSFDFFKKIYDDKENTGNLFYSPYSVFSALAMVYEGAKGDTAIEMEDVLSIEQDNESFHEYMKSLYNNLNYNDKYDISTANALWPDVGFNLIDDYVSVIESYYGGNAEEVEYAYPKKAAETINNWVENQTNNLIEDLVPPDIIDPVLTKLILTNAIYFKGIWKIQFDEANTTLKNFTLLNNEKIEVDTMKLVDTENRFNYTETEDLQILELPYKGDEISMIIILPGKNSDVSDIVDSINKETYNNWIKSMTKKECDIYLPKFEFKTSYSLKDYLNDLGMEKAFSTKADFSDISNEGQLFLSHVLHKAFVKVNEEGTEAAAATAAAMKLTAFPGEEDTRKTFDCDHPFLFTIHHKKTDTVLFMGEVKNPTE